MLGAVGRRRARLDTRLSKLASLSSAMRWTGDGSADLENLTRLADALVYVARGEVEYYKRRRDGRRRWGTTTRSLAFLLGTAGLVVPLMVAAIPSLPIDASAGYVFLAAAGASLVGNRLFGATEGHIRYVTALYALEGVAFAFTLRWEQWKSGSPQAGATDITEAFKHLEGFRADIFKALTAETQMWASDLRAAEGQYAKSLGRS